MDTRDIPIASTSWRRQPDAPRGAFPYQIHLRLVGAEAAMRWVERVVDYFDPAYAQNRPDGVDPIAQAYAQGSTDWPSGFTVYELANGYSVVRAAVKLEGQSEIEWLSPLVDITAA